MNSLDIIQRQEQILDELEFCECAKEAQQLMDEHYALDTAFHLINGFSNNIPTIEYQQ